MAKELSYLFTRDFPSHRDAILDLWQRVNGDPKAASFDSFYAGNPLGPPSLGLCYDGERLVGTENYLTQQFASDGACHRVAVGVDTLVDPAYRLFHGVFGKLCKLTMERLNPDMDYLFTLPNENSLPYYVKYFGWQQAGALHVYKKMIGAAGFSLRGALALVRRGRRHRGVELERVESFDPDMLDPVLETYRERARHAFFYKDADFINWKFLANTFYPCTGYLLRHQGRPCGYAIVHVRGREFRVLDILVAGDDPGVFSRTLSTLALLAREQGSEQLVLRAAPSAWYAPLLRRQMFFKRWEEPFLATSAKQPLPQGDWVVTAGDFDVF